MTDREAFIAWFLENYPPGCHLNNPEWHAEKIFARARADNTDKAPEAPAAVVGLVSSEWLEANAPALFDTVLLEGRRRAGAVIGDPKRWPELEPTGGDRNTAGKSYREVTTVGSSGRPYREVITRPPFLPIGTTSNDEADNAEALRGKSPIGSSDRNPIEQDAPTIVTEPAPSTPAVIVDNIAGAVLPELRPLVDRLTQLDADEREEIFKTYNLIDDVVLGFIRRDHPSRAASDAAVIRHALTLAYGGGGEIASRTLRNVSDVVERRLASQRLRSAGDRNQPGA